MLKMANFESEDTHPALKNYVILRGILHNFTNKDLKSLRHVSSHFNFAATSELLCRNYSPPKLTLSQQPTGSVKEHNDYLKFEQRRRDTWDTLYQSNYPLIKFRHLRLIGHCTDTLSHFLRTAVKLNLLTSVTTLGVPMQRKTSVDLLTDYFLPSFVNLRHLEFYLEEEVSESEAENDFSWWNHHAERLQGRKYPKVRIVTIVWNQEAPHFPWFLLGCFCNIDELQLLFFHAAPMIECARDLVAAKSVWEIRKIYIELLTPSRDPHDLFEQFKAETVIQTESYAAANADICNHFKPDFLCVGTTLPLAHVFLFLEKLQTRVSTKRFVLQVATPLNVNVGEEMLDRRFGPWLVCDIIFRFPHLVQLTLDFFQYVSEEVPPRILRNANLNDELHSNCRLNKLEVFTQPGKANYMDGATLAYEPIAIYGDALMHSHSAAFQKLTQLVYYVGSWRDCALILDALRLDSIAIRKLTLRAMASPLIRNGVMQRECLFPNGDVNDWTYEDPPPPYAYEGIFGLRTLQVLEIREFGIAYEPVLESRVLEVPKLKTIHLNSKCNCVEPKSVFVFKFAAPWPWPSKVGHVAVHAQDIVNSDSDG